MQIYQGVHGLDRTTKQQSHYLRDMDDPNKKGSPKNKSRLMICRKIAALEKQLQWEKLRADALDTLINVAEDKLNISIRKSLEAHSPGIKRHIVLLVYKLSAGCWAIRHRRIINT
ncbi:MAG: hypothetical protein IPK90_02835 [Chitinophagaceae bacterium]|nr:hypothetical protein [Chitinophagaceae bacterium]